MLSLQLLHMYAFIGESAIERSIETKSVLVASLTDFDGKNPWMDGVVIS